MRTKQECYDLIKDGILSHGFDVKYYDPAVSPDQTPHLAERSGKGDEAHDVMFVLRMDRVFGTDRGVIKLAFTGSPRISGGQCNDKVLMRMARELRDGARLVKYLNELELEYIDKDYEKPEKWRTRYAR